MSISIRDLGDFEGKYDIDESQALRILAQVDDLDAFEHDWQHCDYWKGSCDEDI